MFCTKCGSEMPDNAKFCTNCGAAAEAPDVVNSFNDIIDEDVISLVGEKNTQYYINRFTEMKQGGKKNTWNWPAFLFGPAWFAYRKMYTYAAVVAVINIVAGNLASIVTLAVSAVWGVFANYIYMDTLEKHSLKMKSMDSVTKQTYTERNGGASAKAALAAYIILVVISAVLEIL